MARLPVLTLTFALTALAFAGCLGGPEQGKPVSLPPVRGDVPTGPTTPVPMQRTTVSPTTYTGQPDDPDRARPSSTTSAPPSQTPSQQPSTTSTSAPPQEPQPDCETDTVSAGWTQVSRITCAGGSGRATLQVTGCLAGGEDPSWMTLDTADGRLASGNATAVVQSGGETLAMLRVDAAEDDGKETMMPARGSYVLTLELDAWAGQWVAATVECPTA